MPYRTTDFLSTKVKMSCNKSNLSFLCFEIAVYILAINFMLYAFASNFDIAKGILRWIALLFILASILIEIDKVYICRDEIFLIILAAISVVVTAFIVSFLDYYLFLG